MVYNITKIDSIIVNAVQFIPHVQNRHVIAHVPECLIIDSN